MTLWKNKLIRVETFKWDKWDDEYNKYNHKRGFMKKLMQISSFLVVIVLVSVIAGCIDNGDVGTVIGNWNKIIAKQEQIVQALDYSASSLNTNSEDLNVLRQSAQRSNSYLESAQRLLEEEDSLISDFAGSTVKVTGDAKTYADIMLINIREAHSNRVKVVTEQQNVISIYQNVITALESGDLDRADTLTKSMDNNNNINIYSSKISDSISKANDAVKRLEALQ